MAKGRKPDTPEEALVRAEIVAKGFGGKLSPKMVMQISREALYPHVMEGKRDYQISKEFKVSQATISFLRKFYDLPNTADVDRMLERADSEREPVSPEEAGTAMSAVLGKLEKIDAEQKDSEITFEYEGVPIAAAEPDKPAPFLGAGIKEGEETISQIIKETIERITKETVEELTQGCATLEEPAGVMQTFEPPLLDIESEQAAIIAPMINGIAKMLDRMGKTKVSVTVVVRRV